MGDNYFYQLLDVGGDFPPLLVSQYGKPILGGHTILRTQGTFFMSVTPRLYSGHLCCLKLSLRTSYVRELVVIFWRFSHNKLG